jgi:hypothetical protein
VSGPLVRRRSPGNLPSHGIRGARRSNDPERTRKRPAKSIDRARVLSIGGADQKSEPLISFAGGSTPTAA